MALSARVHIYARPESRERLIWCFTEVLGCQLVASGDAPKVASPVLAFVFPDGGSLSVEFSEDALDEDHARWGAWLEIRADDPSVLQAKVTEAGLPRVHHPGNDHFYVVAPGGQVLRIV
jgi:hypothetical protein